MVVTVASTVAVRASLADLLGSSAPLLAFVLPVAICATLGGLRVGLVSMLAALAAGVIFFILPYHERPLSSAEVIARLVLFLVVSVVICVVSERMHREINRSRGAERALREREEAILRGASYFRTLFASRSLGFIAWRSPNLISDANDAFLEMLDYTRDDLAARGGVFDWNEITPPEHRAADDLAFRQLVETGICLPYEKEYFRKDGSRVPVLMGGVVDTDRPEGISGVAYAVDLSRLRRTEQALRESEARVRFTLEAAQAGWWDWNITGDENIWSEQNFKLFGIDPAKKEASFEAWADSIHPDDRARALAEVQAALAGTTHEYRSEFRILHPERGVRWIIALGQVLRDENGKPARMLGLNLDITTRKAAEDLERAARAEAERASRLKDEFVATLSHELRTPLTAVLGWAQVLRRSNISPDKLDRGLEVIERNTRLLSQLVSDLLDVSRIVTGKIRLDLAPLDLPAVVRRAVETLRFAADTKGVRLAVDITPIDEPLLGDAARIEQVVWNLLSNAIKFTLPGGLVELRLTQRRGIATITVHDTGQGIAPEFLPHLFERFRQEDASSSRRYGGLGLGLSLVKHIADLHGGRVYAESPGPGRGSTFTVELPLRQAAPIARAS